MAGKAVLSAVFSISLFAASGHGPARAQDATDPETCRDMWEVIGLPETRKDLGEGDFVFVCHDGFLTFHNNTTKTPDWVIQRMTAAQVSGDNSRPNKSFVQEKAAPRDKRARNQDYTNSDFARGHQAASEDYNIDVDLMKDTFVYSNALPQIGAGFNSGVWSGLEALVRDLARSRGEIYVITGPVYQAADGGEILVKAAGNPCGKEIRLPSLTKKSVCDANDDDDTAACPAGVAVPAALFKVIYDPGMKRANAYVIPNLNHTPLKDGTDNRAYLKEFQISIDRLEELIEIDLFPRLSSRRRRMVEEKCAAPFFH